MKIKQFQQTFLQADPDNSQLKLLAADLVELEDIAQTHVYKRRFWGVIYAIPRLFGFKEGYLKTIHAERNAALGRLTDSVNTINSHLDKPQLPSEDVQRAMMGSITGAYDRVQQTSQQQISLKPSMTWLGFLSSLEGKIPGLAFNTVQNPSNPVATQSQALVMVFQPPAFRFSTSDTSKNPINVHSSMKAGSFVTRRR